MSRPLTLLPPRGVSERYPIAPDTVTVLGNRWKPDAPWRGLDFTKARLRTQSTLMLYVCGPDEAPYDLHLAVPWCHPDDQPEGWDDEMVYRVRPIAEPGKRWRRRMVAAVAIEPAPDKDPPWEIVVTFVPPRGVARGASSAKPRHPQGSRQAGQQVEGKDDNGDQHHRP